MNQVKGRLSAKLARTLLFTMIIVGATIIVVVGALQVRASERQLLEIQTRFRETLMAKGSSLANNHALALRSLVSDNAFSDVHALIEKTVHADPDVLYGLFLDVEGKAWAFSSAGAGQQEQSADAWKELGLSVEELRLNQPRFRDRLFRGSEVFEFSAPVSEENQLLGTVVYGISSDRMRQGLSAASARSRSELLRTLWLLGALVVLSTAGGVASSLRQTRRITDPLRELTRAASALAAGDRTVSVSIRCDDELEILGSSFNQMARDLNASYEELAAFNKTLEEKVERRTAELAHRNRDMRLVLDNVQQGFLTVSRKGELAAERSRVVDDWLAPYDRGQGITEYLSSLDAAFGANFGLSWEMLVEDCMPQEVTVGQLPRRLSRGGRELEFAYAPLSGSSGQFDGLLLVVSDITEALARRRSEGQQQEVVAVFSQLMKDRPNFLAFREQASRVIQNIVARSFDDVLTFRRELHTLKGNAGLMGLDVLAGRCHELEAISEETRGIPLENQSLALKEHWHALSETVSLFVGDSEVPHVEVPRAEYDATVAALSRARIPAQLLKAIQAWSLEPVSKAFERVSTEARSLAERLGKGRLEVSTSGGNVGLEPQRWAPFWRDLVHVTRNAVDHGLESPEERARCGKFEPARLTLDATHSAGTFTIAVADNGRGIDWQAVASKAKERGLPTDTEAALLSALLAPGISTRDAVTEISGRGVGMAAIHERVTAMGGWVEVHTELGVGTTWAFRFPEGKLTRSLLPISPERLD